MVIRKLQKINNSYYVVLDKTYLQALGLKRGDYVIVTLAKTAIRIAKLRVKKRVNNKKGKNER